MRKVTKVNNPITQSGCDMAASKYEHSKPPGQIQLNSAAFIALTSLITLFPSMTHVYFIRRN